MHSILACLKKEKYLFEDFPTFFTPAYIPVIIQKVFSEATKEEYNKSIRKIGWRFGRVLLRAIWNKTKNKNKHPAYFLFLSQLSFFGLGEFTVKRQVKNKTLLIKQTNNFFAKQYKKMFGIQKKSVDWFVLGLLEGGFYEANGECMHGTEVECAAQDKQDCIYLLEKKACICKRCNEIILPLFELKKVSCSPFIKKIVQANQLTLDRGVLKLWSIPTFCFPFLLTDQLFDAPDMLKNLAKYICSVQTKIAVHFQACKFGIKDKRKILENLLYQQETMLGFLVSISILSGSKLQFELNKTFLDGGGGFTMILNSYVFLLFEESIRQLLGKEIKSITPALKNPAKLIIALKPSTQDYLKLLEAKVPKEYRELITEKINYKYFLA